MSRRWQGRSIRAGQAEGETLCADEAISFFGGVDPDSGVVTQPGHPLQGQSVSGKVLVFPGGKGSTVGSYTLFRMARGGTAPAALVNQCCETIVAVGAIIGEIPCVDQVPVESIPDGARVRVDGGAGVVVLLDEAG